MQLVKVRGKSRSSTRLDEERTNPVLCIMDGVQRDILLGSSLLLRCDMKIGNVLSTSRSFYLKFFLLQ